MASINSDHTILLSIRSLQLVILCSLSWQCLAEYQPDALLCPAQPEDAYLHTPEQHLTGNKTVINADDSKVQGNIFSLDGNVEIQAADKLIRADHINYDNNTGTVEMSGKVRLNTEIFRVDADKGQASTRNNQAQFTEIQYRIKEFSGRGMAKSLAIHDRTSATLNKLTYTTCPPGNEDWILKADKMRIDQQEEVGRATNVSLWFKDVPLMYLPEFSFPTGDKRKSGFLNPRLGQSTKMGTELHVPWYWNIAPNRDATIGLHQMSKRGSQLYTEYRHLHSNAETNLKFDYLNDDINGQARYQTQLLHSGKFSDRWQVLANIKDVSDNEYFNDLGESLVGSNISFLPRYINLQRNHSLGFLLIRAHEFQALDVADTYQRLPQIILDLESRNARYQFQGELTRFDHRDDVTLGTRLDLTPSVQYEWSNDAYFIKPAAYLRHTRYQLHNTGIGQDKQLDRTTPIFSVDSGMFLERPLQLNGQSQTLTLEPRLFYLYAPYDDQSNIPIFDTTIPDFRFAGLFRKNRFVGPDRQSDANQLTLAVSSRLIDNTDNRERLRLSIGQTIYFDERNVTLPGSTVDFGDYSDFTGEVEGQFTENSQFRVSGLWDPDTSKVNKAVIAYGYKRDEKHHYNVSYRYQRELFEQTELSGRWRLGINWHGFAGWTYSLRDNQSIESALGFEYESCCWSIQVGARRYLSDNGTDKDNSVYIQLNLKGMTNVGSSVEATGDTRLGYRSRSAVQ
jgi:LPS-assembly protein